MKDDCIRDELRRIRGSRSQREMAALCGVSQQSISQWERAKATPKITKIIILERIFNEPKESLFPDIFD